MDGYCNFSGSSRKHKALTPWRHTGKPPPWWSSIRFPKTPWGWTLHSTNSSENLLYHRFHWCELMNLQFAGSATSRDKDTVETCCL